MQLKLSVALLYCALSTLLLAGCTKMGSVTESDKDATGQYDGLWKVSVQPGARTQFPYGRWRSNCKDMSRTLQLAVKDGVATLSNVNGKHKTYVDNSGRFRYEIPSNQRRVALGGGAELDAGEVTYIVTGNLARQSGSWVDGVRQFGNSGCKTSMTFAKKGA